MARHHKLRVHGIEDCESRQIITPLPVSYGGKFVENIEVQAVRKAVRADVQIWHAPPPQQYEAPLPAAPLGGGPQDCGDDRASLPRSSLHRHDLVRQCARAQVACGFADEEKWDAREG